MDTENHSRRNAIALLAGAVPALCATSTVGMAAQHQSREFLECTALWDEEQRLCELAGKEKKGENHFSDAFKATYDKFDEAAEKLAATPHSKQKLKELLTLAARDQKAAPGGIYDGCDRMVILLGAALETFDALGEVA
ncbi:hypothetical protein [Hyphomicrobium sp. DY-1]|uniref:hypothetical protein n=1 Tax=Hyphomicrobium sp. DY-1 TaxID=3075650 RepID=UPI0039C0071A